jgi:hypothetical protein
MTWPVCDACWPVYESWLLPRPEAGEKFDRGWMDTCRKTDVIVSVDAKRGRVADYNRTRRATLDRIMNRCQTEHQ